MSRTSSSHVVSSFLSDHTAITTEHMDWLAVEIKLVASAYITDEVPPPDYITSVRTLVFQSDKILLMQNRDRAHILPGGRVESGETPVEALQREIREEAGLEITDIQRLGFVHLQHQTPKPARYAYPYPDFFWPVFRSEYHGKCTAPQEPDDYEISAAFVSLAELGGLRLRPLERAFLAAAKRGR